jgi:hypothetical protein
MDYEAYRKSFFTDPPPVSPFKITGLFGVTLLFADYERALAFYSQVLGPPAYVEGESTRGWKIGGVWLTMLSTDEGSPQNMDIQFGVGTLEEAERLNKAFIEAGATGEEPADVLMYEPVRIYPLSDPFGTDILIVVRL